MAGRSPVRFEMWFTPEFSCIWWFIVKIIYITIGQPGLGFGVGSIFISYWQFNWETLKGYWIESYQILRTLKNLRTTTVPIIRLWWNKEESASTNFGQPQQLFWIFARSWTKTTQSIVIQVYISLTLSVMYFYIYLGDSADKKSTHPVH